MGLGCDGMGFFYLSNHPSIHLFILRYVRRVFTDEVLRDMVGSGEVVAEIEREWEQLLRDRHCLRQIFPKGNNKVKRIRNWRLASVLSLSKATCLMFILWRKKLH